MSSEQVEAYYTAHNGELHKCYRAEDVEPLLDELEAQRKENERLRGLLDHLNSINYSASGELGNLWPITGELQDQIDATLEEQDPTSD